MDESSNVNVDEEIVSKVNKNVCVKEKLTVIKQKEVYFFLKFILTCRKY